jgi:hypothetical protein
LIAIALVLAVVAIGSGRIFFQPIPAQLGHAWADIKRRTGLDVLSEVVVHPG